MPHGKDNWTVLKVAATMPSSSSREAQAKRIDRREGDSPGIPSHYLEEFAKRVGHLITSDVANKMHGNTKDRNDYSEPHIRNVLTVINTAIDLAEKWATTQDHPITRREKLAFAIGLVYNLRTDLDATLDITFRDADHYFAGRLQEWQDWLRLNGNRDLNTKEEPSRVLSYLSPMATYAYDELKHVGLAPQTNPDHPAAAPGNRYWADLGGQHFDAYDKNGSTKSGIIEKPTEQEAVKAAKDEQDSFMNYPAIMPSFG